MTYSEETFDDNELMAELLREGAAALEKIRLELTSHNPISANWRMTPRKPKFQIPARRRFDR